MAGNEGFQIDKRFKKTVKGRFERFTFRVGVLRDKPHREPKPVSQVLRDRKSKARPKAKSKPVPTKAKVKPKKKLGKNVNQRIAKAKSKVKRKSKAKRKNDKLVKSNSSRGLGTMAGGPVRLKKASTKGTVAQVAEYVRKVHEIPYLTAPFLHPRSKEMRMFRSEMMNLIVGNTKNYHKAEASLRDVLRVPFLKKRYGNNSEATRKVKTFNRLGIDTGQFWRALEGQVRVNPNVPK